MADKKRSTGSTTLTDEEFNEVTLRLAHIQALVALTQGHYQSDDGPLPSTLAVMREQLQRADQLLMEAAHRG